MHEYTYNVLVLKIFNYLKKVVLLLLSIIHNKLPMLYSILLYYIILH